MISFKQQHFLNCGKRKQAIIVWEWDLQNIEEDAENRPEFETTAKNFRTNPVTKEREPYIPTWTKIYRYFVTASVVTLMVITLMYSFKMIDQFNNFWLCAYSFRIGHNRFWSCWLLYSVQSYIVFRLCLLFTVAQEVFYENMPKYLQQSVLQLLT